MRDAKNLDQDSDKGNAEMHIDFIGSYERTLHNLRFS